MRIGYLGVGNMGQPMASRLLDGGHEVWLYDVKEAAMQPLVERQARRTGSPKELADACETVAVSLPTLDIFREAVTGSDGLLSGKAIKTLVNTCTVGGPFLEEIVAACAARGVTVIDAPITGGPVGAAAGTLAVMVAGDQAKIAELMPVFRCWGPTIVNAGEKPGAAQVMKLVNNVIFCVGLIATAEGMTIAKKAGIPAELMLQLLNNGSARNFATTTVYPKAVVPGTLDFGATLDILRKDVELAVEQGEALGVPMQVCQAARLVLMHAVFQGRGQHDLSRIGQFIEDAMKPA